jgi:hypothetical protein
MHAENRVISACISAKLDSFGTLWRSLGLCQWILVLLSVEKGCVTFLGETCCPELPCISLLPKTAVPCISSCDGKKVRRTDEF